MSRRESVAAGRRSGASRSGALLAMLGSRRAGLGELHVLRFVEGTSALHRLWAGTKLVVLAAISIALLLWPSWSSVGIAAVVLLAAYLGARLPRGISPRLPRWIVLLVLVGLGLAAAAGGGPYVSLWHLRVGLGGLDNWTRLMAIGIEVLAGAAILGWTTPLADLSPALGRLLGPLRRVRVPVDELVAAIALSVRCLPLLLEEARVLRAARRSRRVAAPRSFQQLLEEAVEGLFGSLSSAIRRAAELADAIDARGGVPTVAPEAHRLAGVDFLALGAAVVAVGVMGVLR